MSKGGKFKTLGEKPETFSLMNGRTVAHLTLAQIVALTYNYYAMRAFEWGVPYEQAFGFVNGFQVAALIARIPYEQAINFNNLDQIINHFNHRPAANLQEAIGGLTLFISGQTIVNGTPADLLQPFVLLQGQLAHMLAIGQHPMTEEGQASANALAAPTIAPSSAPTSMPTAEPTGFSTLMTGFSSEPDLSGHIKSFFGPDGCGGFK